MDFGYDTQAICVKYANAYFFLLTNTEVNSDRAKGSTEHSAYAA